MPKPGDDEVIALHEAAHAVICVVKGLALNGATIGPAGKRIGEVVGPKYCPPRKHQQPAAQERELACKYVAYILAGMAAEEKKFGPKWQHGGSKDMLQAHGIAADNFAEKAQIPWVAEVLDEARLEVCKHWDAIQSIATVLLQRDVTEADIVSALT